MYPMVWSEFEGLGVYPYMVWIGKELWVYIKYLVLVLEKAGAGYRRLILMLLVVCYTVLVLVLMCGVCRLLCVVCLRHVLCCGGGGGRDGTIIGHWP